MCSKCQFTRTLALLNKHLELQEAILSQAQDMRNDAEQYILAYSGKEGARASRIVETSLDDQIMADAMMDEAERAIENLRGHIAGISALKEEQ